MNIAFLLITLNRGGIENLTCFLANEFANKGHKVVIISLKPEHDDELVSTLRDSIIVTYLNGFSCCRNNVNKLNAIFKTHEIHCVINQFGLPYIPCKLVMEAGRGLNIKLISAYHSDPCANGRLLPIDQQIRQETKKTKRLLLKLKYKLFKQITSSSMRYVYNKSDAYVLLSACFKCNFVKFTGIKEPQKLQFISNPVTIDSTGFRYCEENKFKQLLFVGRIDNTIKRIDRILDIWHNLEQYYPDWELVVVGDGPDLPYLKKYAKKIALSRVSFKGRQFPAPFYKDASILLLTSEFEGFGLVLVEGMSFGVVPVAYGSYASINDIIEDGINGYIVKPSEGDFPEGLMTTRIRLLMDDKNLRNQMAMNSLKIVNRFQKDTILKQWEELIKNI